MENQTRIVVTESITPVTLDKILEERARMINEIEE